MGFWLIAFIVLAATIAISLLLPKPNLENRKPAALGDFQFPTVDETRLISFIRGTVLQEGFNTLDAGDFRAEPIKKSVPNPATLGITKKKVTVGYRYHVGLIMGLADATWPVRLKQVFCDKQEVWSGDIVSGTVTVNKPELHGGDEKQGGFVAYLDYYGDAWQHAPNAYWESVVMSGAPSPTYNGQALIVQRGPSAGKIGTSFSGYFSTSRTVPALGFALECCPAPFGDPAKARLNDGDYNVANFLWEFLTNTDWGMAQTTAQIDVASFIYAQDTFYTEGMGVSVKIDTPRKLADFVRDLERLADCALYVEPTTGQWTLKLIRADYDPDTLLVLDETNVTSYESLDIPAPLEAVNHVMVQYLDKSTWKERIADAKDGAGRFNQGYAMGSEITEWGCSYATLAARLALREQIQLALNLPRAIVRANRKAHKLRAGDAFWLGRESRNIPKRIFRAVRVTDASLTDGEIEIEAVLDVFAFTDQRYALPTPPPSQLIGAPVPAPDAVFEEQPYFLSGANPRVHAYAGQPNGNQEAYDFFVSTDNGSIYGQRDSSVEFCPVAAAVNAYPRNTPVLDAASLIVSNVSNIADVEAFTPDDLRSGFNLFRWAAGEICACESITALPDGTYRLNNVWRGLLDTTPQAHAAGEKLFFFPYGYTQPEENFLAGQLLKSKVLPRTYNNVLSLASATALELTMARRYERPLPPANVMTGGSYTNTAIPAPGVDIGFTWNTRDRLTQRTVIRQDEANIGPEAGTTYKVTVYGGDGSALAVYSGLTGTSWTHTAANQTADGSALQSALIYAFVAVRDGLESWMPHVKALARPGGSVPTGEPGGGSGSGSGYGTNYGATYGG